MTREEENKKIIDLAIVCLCINCKSYHNDECDYGYEDLNLCEDEHGKYFCCDGWDHLS